LPLVAWSGPDEFEVILDAQNLNDAMDLDGFRWLLDATLATRAPLPAEPNLARAA
jgi:hypothetical protein